MEAIHVAPERSAKPVPLERVRAVRGRGLEGDRYFDYARRISRTPRKACALTLIEAEALEAVESELGLRVDPGETRRNVLTRGVRLNDLVGRQFRLGDVIARGILRCEPCRHLESLTDKALIRPLVGRGGLRAEVLRSGWIAVGDAVQVE